MKLSRNSLRRLILKEMAQLKDGSYDDTIAPFDYELQGATTGRGGYADLGPHPDGPDHGHDGEYMGAFVTHDGERHEIYRDEGEYYVSGGDAYPDMDTLVLALIGDAGHNPADMYDDSSNQ